jgi:hypothetical protein
MDLIDMSMLSALINIIPYQSWLKIGFGVSLFFNIVFGMLAIGILYPFPQVHVNPRLLDITIGGLWALLGSFFVSAINGDGPFKEPILMVIVFGAFIGTTITLVVRVFRTPNKDAR